MQIYAKSPVYAKCRETCRSPRSVGAVPVHAPTGKKARRFQRVSTLKVTTAQADVRP